jgi:hypothetical protein
MVPSNIAELAELLKAYQPSVGLTQVGTERGSIVSAMLKRDLRSLDEANRLNTFSSTGGSTSGS